MDTKSFFIHFLNVLAIVLYIGLLGLNIYPLTGLYGPRLDWWGGNSADRFTMYAGGAAVIGMVALTIHLEILQRKRKVPKKITRAIQVIGLCGGICVSGACMPYFIIPYQVGNQAVAQLTKAFGADWANQVHRPADGPWLDVPYSPLEQYMANDLYSKTSYTFLQNITYLTIGSDSFDCDCYLPNGAGPNPVLIFIHGGGWLGGDKNGYIGYQLQYFAAAGYTVFSVQYGSIAEAGRTRQFSMAEMLANLGAFSDWIAEPGQVSDYHANLSRCFITGLSAGGHLSALLGVARSVVAGWNSSVHVLGAIDYYGISDLRHWSMVNQQWFNQTGLFNSTVLVDYSIVDTYSPMTYAETPALSGGDIVPMLIFHGDADSVVPVSQSSEMSAMLDSRGYKSVFIEFPKAEHVFEGSNNAAPAQITLWAMERFMQLCAL